jgi:lipoprotein-anchoring transpeptidase ErfK/SrfK
MHTLRRHLSCLAVLAAFVLLPVTAFANDPPIPTPPAVEPSPPPEGSATSVPIADDAFSIWHGVVRAGGAYRRAAPSSAAEIEEELDPGTPVRVDGWVGGSMLYPDVITWGAVDPDDGGGYIFGGSLQGVLPPAVPPPPVEMQDSTGTWIDVNLTLNVVSVYASGQPVKMILTSPGRPGFQTDVGRFSIRSKVLSQTMTGPGYVVPRVPSVEYFYGGEALHGRYWTLPDVQSQTFADVNDDGQIQVLDDSSVEAGGPNRGVAFGVPSSHGCLGVDVDAAAWLYSLTTFGTTVDVHY